MRRKLTNIFREISYNIGRFLAFIGHNIDRLKEQKPIQSPRSVLITGATSGIGAELARQYAAPGVFLYLTGRDGARLNKITQECTSRGAKVAARVIDSTSLFQKTISTTGRTGAPPPLDEDGLPTD